MARESVLVNREPAGNPKPYSPLAVITSLSIFKTRQKLLLENLVLLQQLGPLSISAKRPQRKGNLNTIFGQSKKYRRGRGMSIRPVSTLKLRGSRLRLRSYRFFCTGHSQELRHSGRFEMCEGQKGECWLRDGGGDLYHVRVGGNAWGDVFLDKAVRGIFLEVPAQLSHMRGGLTHRRLFVTFLLGQKWRFKLLSPMIYLALN